MNKMIRAMTAVATAVPLLGAASVTHQHQWPIAHSPIATIDTVPKAADTAPAKTADTASVHTVSAPAKGPDATIITLILQAVHWRADTAVIDSASAAVLASVPDSLMRTPPFTQADIMQVVTSNPTLVHANSPDIPVVLEPGAPAIIINGTPVTSRTFTLHILEVVSIAALKPNPHGIGGSNGAIQITSNP